MAETLGFEPRMQVAPHNTLAGCRLQPTRPSLHDVFDYGGGGGIRTHAPFYWPSALAVRPLRPTWVLLQKKGVNITPYNL